VAHHVIQHAAALQIASPEPGRMRTAVLLGGARQIRPAGETRSPSPDAAPTLLHVRREKLILEVSMLQAGPLDQPGDLERFGDRTGQWLLAGDASQGAPVALDGVDQLLDVVDAGVIGAAEPDRLDAWIGDHGRDGA